MTTDASDGGAFVVNNKNYTVLEGSYKGTKPAGAKDGVTASLETASGSKKGPRDQMAGQQNSRNYNEDGKAFRSTPCNLSDSDAGNS
jgi:hypothetical protein